jgi:hypothetical protein
VLRLRSDHFWAQYLQAVCYLRQKRWGEAEVGLNVCLGQRPKFAWLLPLLGAAHTGLMQHDAAEDDLIVANSLDNSIQVAFQQPDGTFSTPLTLPTGQAPSDIIVTDVNGDGLPDIAVSNQVSGDVSRRSQCRASTGNKWRQRAVDFASGLLPLSTVAAACCRE